MHSALRTPTASSHTAAVPMAVALFFGIAGCPLLKRPAQHELCNCG